jgi:RNA polymerase sigma-70 factor (ECF subfamily)
MADIELIRGVIARDRASVTCLVETYQKRVIKTAYYFLGNMQDAEDIAQEVFVEIVNAMPGFRQSSALSTWIYRITVNRSLNAIRRNRQRQIFIRIEKLFGLESNAKPEFERSMAHEFDPMTDDETRKLLKDTVSGLPDNQRTVFILNKYEELSYKEISEVTGLSISAVESLLHRAKINLQKKLVSHFSEYQKT